MSEPGVGPSVRPRRVLVIGATSQVGRQLVAELTQRGDALDVVAAARAYPDPTYAFDLLRPETIERLIAAHGPDHVILTAAETNVAWCEEHPEESRAANVVAPVATAVAAQRAGASLTFLSTDYVFDGIHGPSSEEDAVNPINAYGRQKLEAERAVLAADASNLVLRTCQVFGADPRRKNFVLRVADALRDGETVTAAGDLFGTPTYAPDLAKAAAALTVTRACGVWHVAGDTSLSRYDLALMVADAFGYDREWISEVPAGQMDDPVNRPRHAGLRNGRLEEAGMDLITPLADALADLAAPDRRR